MKRGGKKKTTTGDMFSNSLGKLEPKKRDEISKKRKREEKPSTSTNQSNLRKKRKFSNQNDLEPIEKQKRTIRISNIPFHGEKLQILKRKMKALFKKFGEIESIRFRSLPVKRKNKIPLDVLVKMGQFKKSENQNILCFIVFKSKKSVNLAIQEMNKTHFNENLIFVERIIKTNENELGNPNAKVFVGNIPFDATQEEILKMFLRKEKVIYGKTTNVKIIKDDEKRSKGVAIVSFENEHIARNAVSKKLNLNLRGFHFRIKKYVPKIKRNKESEGKVKKKKKKRKKSNILQNNDNKDEDESVDDLKGKDVITKKKEWWKGAESSRSNPIKLQVEERKKRKKKKKKKGKKWEN